MCRQSAVRGFVLNNAEIPRELSPGVPLDSWRSIECQIMDLADDIAYSCFDIVDGSKARFLTPEKIANWRNEKHGQFDANQTKYIEELLAMMAKNSLERTMNGMVKITWPVRMKSHERRNEPKPP